MSTEVHQSQFTDHQSTTHGSGQQRIYQTSDEIDTLYLTQQRLKSCKEAWLARKDFFIWSDVIIQQLWEPTIQPRFNQLFSQVGLNGICLPKQGWCNTTFNFILPSEIDDVIHPTLLLRSVKETLPGKVHQQRCTVTTHRPVWLAYGTLWSPKLGRSTRIYMITSAKLVSWC